MKKGLPKNWVESDIESVSHILDNMRKPVSADERSKRLGDIPYYGATGQAGWIDDFIFDEELVLIGEDGAPFFDRLKNVAYLVNGKSWVNNHAHVLKGKDNVLENKFLLHFFNQFDYTKYVGGTTRLKLNQASLKSIPIPLPPLAEQHRIVAKLDTLFTQLETIKTSMANVPVLLKNFRQQVLTQAVTGKLTEEISKEKISIQSTITIGEIFKDAPKKWKWEKLTDLAKLESGHTPRKSEEEYWVNGDVPWISLQDIRAAHGKIISDTKFMPNELGIKKSSARLLPKGTVCFCRDISVGYTTVMGREMSTTQHFANWICGSSLNNMFLLYAFMAAKDFLIASGKGTTVGTIYMPALKELRILLPPIEEQQEIVRRVESLFAKADAIEKQYESLKVQIDTLPQAILHKAFKGELTEQLDSDGDAKVLLEEILRQAQEDKKSKTNKTAAVKGKSYPKSDAVLGRVAEKKRL